MIFFAFITEFFNHFYYIYIHNNKKLIKMKNEIKYVYHTMVSRSSVASVSRRL